MLTRDATTTLTEQLAERYAERIRSRLLAPGARLPSVRDCAQRHGVSPHTVVAAYDQLLAQGLIEARRQRGFFVRNAVASTRAARATAPAENRPVAPVDATALIRSMFHHPGARPSPGLGTLPPEWLDLALLGGALRRVSQGDGLAGHALHYGDPAGDSRRRSSRRWARRRRSTSSRAPCSRRAMRCWSTSPAGPSSSPAWPSSACACCRCRAAPTALTWR